VQDRLRRGPGRFAATLPARLIWPCVLWSLIQSAIVVASARFVNAHTPVEHLTPFRIVSFIWNPPSQFWFLWILLVFHLLALAVGRWAGGLVLIAVGAVAYACTALFPDLAAKGEAVAYLGRAANLLIFYAAGVYIAPRIEALRRSVPAQPLLLILAAALLAGLAAWVVACGLPLYAPLTGPLEIAGTAFVLLFGWTLRAPVIGGFAYIGRRSMPIYIMHFIFLSGSRIALDKLLHWHSAGGLLVLQMLIGVIAPIVAFEIMSRLRIGRLLGLGPPIDDRRRRPAALAAQPLPA
jgi:fucose 4-O-acetylase-like acetyltransferase